MEGLDLASAPPSLTLVIALGGALCVLALLHLHLRSQVSSMRTHYRRLTQNVDGGDLEAVLDRHLSTVEEIAEDLRSLEGSQRRLEVRLQRAVQNVGMVRYNPFHDTGGDQSFSIALLDGSGEGIVITSLYSRTGTRTFAKPVAQGTSKYTLTEEERQAIALALETATPVQG
ncbi:MAG: DUF4446 family protein [Chloroflexi bacterium]|nr:DUF4446 family protein [Chloroflexota bacterium]